MEGTVPGSRVDELADLVAASAIVNDGLDRLSRVKMPQDRADHLRDIAIEAADLFCVTPATAVRGINRAQRQREVERVAKEQANGN